ncbi:MAG: DUF2269 family protein [Gammaproteobacteria bacterium]
MNTYLALKSVHLLGVIVFIGNIIVTGWWKAMADRTGNPTIIGFAQRQVTVTDWIFTAGGVVLVAIGGIGNALLNHMDYLHISWMTWGLWLFVISGVIWVSILIPVQVMQARIARGFEHGGVIPERYWRLNRLWYFFGIIATLIPLANLYFMVFKPN